MLTRNVSEATVEAHKQLKEEAGRLEPLLVYLAEDKASEDLKHYIVDHYHQLVKSGERSRMLGAKPLERRLRLAIAIFCNFKLSYGKPLTYARGNKFFSSKSRYYADWYTRDVLVDVIKILTSPKVDLIRETMGGSYELNPFAEDGNIEYQKLPSIMELTEKGKELLGFFDKDLIGSERPELVVLSNNERYGQKKLKELVEYQDTAETEKWRTEVQTINDYIQSLWVEGAKGETLNNFQLYRGFSRNGLFEDFRYFGRLEGMPWSNWEAERRRAITIDDYPVKEIDFRACTLSILANLNGTPLDDPEIDPYQVGELAQYNRDGIKGIVQTILNRGTTPKKIPSDIKKEFAPEHQGMAMKDFLPIIFELYPFLKDITVHPSFIESEISIKAMLKAIEHGLRVIPLYDAFYCAEDDLEAMLDIVNDTTKELTGYPLFFTIK